MAEEGLNEADWWDEDAARLNALAEAAREIAAKTPTAQEASSRSLTISIDFDRTFAADPDLWGDFVARATQNGDTVVMISRRDDTDENRDHIASTIGDSGDYLSEVMLIGGDTQKETAAAAAGIDVDIWIDDAPHTITARGFCPTGAGGGVDNSCSSKDGGSGDSPTPPRRKERLRDRIEGTQAEADREVAKSQKKVRDIQKKIDAVKDEMSGGAAKARLAAAEKAFSAAKQKVADAAEKLAESKARLADTKARLAASKERLKALTARSEPQDDDDQDLDDILAEIEKAAAELAEANKELDDVASGLDQPDDRAFCPGVSPPENTCSPANKGSGSPDIRKSEVTRAALASIAKTGGFSVHPITATSPTTGYMVSVVPAAETIFDSANDVTEEAVKGFYDENRTAFEANPDLHLGGWVDTTTGKVYFDLSARFDSVDDAIDAAEERKQLAIWDLNEGKEIRQENYDGRRTRPKAARSRSIRLPAGGDAEANRGGSARVRQESDGRDAERRRGAEESLRAFCPTGVGGGVDNSCSSKDGVGSLAIRAPSAPRPSPNKVDNDDPRGRMTGHDADTRVRYTQEVGEWLADQHGIDLRVNAAIGAPPSVGALQTISDGVATLDRLGLEKPTKITLADQDGNAPASYDFTIQQVYVDPDYDVAAVRAAQRDGRLAGRTRADAGSSIVHEMTHHEHWRNIVREMGENPDDGIEDQSSAMVRVQGMMGNPIPFIGPMTDPFHRDYRFSFNTKNDDGQPLSGDDCRKVAYEVSEYAMITPLEFVAEVRTGVADGIQYSDRVMQLYDDYRGPPLPKVKGRKVRSVNSKKTPPWEKKKPSARRPQRRPKAA